jgi:hypothetical protein
MLLGIDDHEVVAAHEAGHVINGWSIGVEIKGVRLQATGEILAAVEFRDGELDRVSPQHLRQLVMSGLAGQIFADVPWALGHVGGDVSLIGPVVDETDSEGLTDARLVIEEQAVGFRAIQRRLLEGLSNGEAWVSDEELRLLAAND